MLKELVKERLMAAADEIFALFERTIASYEEELCRTREENERQRQQLEAVSKTQRVLHIEGTQQLFGHQEERPPPPHGGRTTASTEAPQPAYVKEEEEGLWTTPEGECLLWPEETDFTKLPLTGVSVKMEELDDKPSENGGAEPPSSSSPKHMTTDADGDHCGGSQADNLQAPLSDSDDATLQCPEDDTREPLSSDTDDMRTHTDDKHSKCSQKKTDVRQTIGRQEEHLQEDLQPVCVKEEEEELWTTEERECLLRPEETDLTKLPLTGVSVKTEDQEDKPQAENLPAPLSDSDDTEDDDWDDTQEPLSSDADREGDTRTRTDRKHSKCSKKQTTVANTAARWQPL
ncbi:uncharacterized protein LOC129179383 isoform X2 [Dunckerocampus dactyliophorus]|uniref:uncharacterized protein LOC129179383 isoform X2 n=1 Tax=Dunckerocampus dactyliophorus TaxID=161453 RepID=UPI002404C554|nr:uncharacterized protein LOC129179383 isoform X2 [Dunckerocampus dactyliophorus]